MRNNLLRAILVALTVAYAGVASAADPGTRVAAQTLQIGTGVGLLTTSGYMTTGDLGAAHYKRDTSLTSCGFQSADGAFWTLAEPVVNPVMCGAIPDDGLDDTTAITTALSYATTYTKPLSIPNGTFVVSGSGAAIFTVTKPIQITGRGYYSVIQVAAGVPATCDVFLYPSTADAVGYNFALFRDFRIQGAAAGVGRHGINITTPTNAFVFRFGVERMEFSNLAGYGVWADQSAVNTSVHTSWVKDSRFLGNGFGGVSLYDSWLLENNQFAGTGYAVNITSVAGAGKFTLRNSNVTASSGVKIGGSAGGPANILIENDYFEVIATYDGDSAAYVNLAGASGFPLNGPIVQNNIFTVLAGFGDPNALRLDFTANAIIESNWYNIVPAASFANIVTANSKNAYIAPDNVSSVATPGNRLSNAGLNTAGGSKTLAILNADSTAIANTNVLTAFDKTYAIKANYLKPGQVVRIRAAGKYGVTGTPVLTLAIRIGTQAIASNGVTTTAGSTTANWAMEGEAVFRTIGATATVARANRMQILGASTLGANLTLATNADLTIDVTATWSVADPANTVTLTQLVIEVIDAPTIN